MIDRALCPRVAFACTTDVAHVLAIASTEAISPSETPRIDGVFVENSLPEPASRTSLAAAMTIMILLVKGRLALLAIWSHTTSFDARRSLGAGANEAQQSSQRRIVIACDRRRVDGKVCDPILAYALAATCRIFGVDLALQLQFLMSALCLGLVRSSP